MPLQITAARPDPALLDLPWEIPLEEWPAESLAALPRGISRHVVRFVRMSGRVIAIKEIDDSWRRREYGLLRLLNRLDQPAVEPLAVVCGRTDADGNPLESALVTQHLQFSLPYRALFSQTLRPDTAHRLVDALAALLVRLHLTGFFWGDVLAVQHAVPPRRRGVRGVPGRRRDRRPARHADRGQREYDLDLARTNIAGELMDLEAGGLLEDGSDPRARPPTRSSHALPLAVGRADRAGVLRQRRALAGRRADPAAQRARASTSTSWPSPPTSTARRCRSSPRSSTPGTTRGGCCG